MNNQKITFSYNDPNNVAAGTFERVLQALREIAGPFPEVDRTILISFDDELAPGADFYFDLALFEDKCVGNRIIFKNLGILIYGKEFDPRILVAKYEELAANPKFSQVLEKEITKVATELNFTPINVDNNSKLDDNR